MAWAAIGKAALGAVKGGAKKIATDKLLGRGKKKKPQKPQQEGAQQEKGGALAIRPTTSLMPMGPTVSSALATTGDSGGAAGGGDDAVAIANSISTKIIRVEKLLAGSLAIKKNIRDQQFKAKDKAKRNKQEAALEKLKPKDAKKGPKLNLPGKGILSRIFGFLGTVILGWIAVRLVDWVPKLTAFIERAAPFVDGFIDFAGKIFDGLTRFIDFSYKLYDAATGWIKNQFGDEAHEKFTTFMGNLKELIKAFLVWKIIGEKIFKSIVSSIRNVWKTVTKAIRTIWVKLRRLIGRKARMFFKNIASKIGGAAKSGIQWAGNIAQKGISRVGGLLSKGGSKLAQTGAGKVAAKVGGFAAKIFGKAASIIAPALKAAKPFATKFLKRIPIFGSLIVGIISLMSGEPLGQALFKTIGAAVGGALGTFIPIPILGTLLGEILGAFVGDLLYYTIIKRDPGKALELVKGALSNLFKGGKAVFNWVKNGFGNFITNFKEEHMIKLPKVLGVQVSLPGIGDKIPNLLQLYNPFAMAPLLVKSFFGGGKEESAAPPGGADAGVESGSKDKEEKTPKAKAPAAKKSSSVPISDDKKDMLLAINQATSYEEIVGAIRKFAPYEQLEGEQSTKTPISTPSGQSLSEEGGNSDLLVLSSGGGSDPYEVLDAFG